MEGDDQVCELEGADARVLEWETGLPSVDDLTPLSQTLIPPDLASAFSITPEPHKSMLDVNFASQSTILTLRRREFGLPLCNYLNSRPSFGEDRFNMESEDNYTETEIRRDGNDHRKGKRLSERDAEEGDLVLRLENDNSNDDQSARALKRSRLVWTPQLHKRFVDVVGHLGIKNAVPKTIMQLMNVEGLTRENVASHLQKYRLYLKRMQGLSNEGPSSSDLLFASTPVPQNLAAASFGSGHREESGHMCIPMPYAPPLLPMPGLGVAHSHGHIAIPINNNHPDVYHVSESHRYSTFGRPVPHRPREQQRDRSGNKLN